MARDVSAVLSSLPGSGKITVPPGVPKFTDSLGPINKAKGERRIKMCMYCTQLWRAAFGIDRNKTSPSSQGRSLVYIM